jgi:valyl-tRNA synthetase
LEGLIDLDVEKNRLEKEMLRLQGLVKSVTNKLSNEKFVNNAPSDVVEKERTKQTDWQNSLDKIKTILADLN